jgi:ABC-2 type transport system permease protein
MLRWVLTQHRFLFGVVLGAQVLMGVGAAIMYRFYIGEVDGTFAAYLVSGIPALSIIPVGFVMVPILVIQEKARGTHEYTWSLPVARLAPVAATFTVFAAISIPVAAVATWVAAGRFGVDLSLSAAALPVAVLVSLMGTSVGYGMAMAIPEPRITNLLVNVIVFLVLMFSPIVVPIERFPDWAEAAHRVLPFFHMANAIRSSVVEGLGSGTAESLAVMGTWLVLGWGAVAWVVGRRD